MNINAIKNQWINQIIEFILKLLFVGIIKFYHKCITIKIYLLMVTHRHVFLKILIVER